MFGQRVFGRLREGYWRSSDLIQWSVHVGPEQDANISTAIVNEPIRRIVRKIENDAGRFSLPIAEDSRSDALHSCRIDLSFFKADRVLDAMKIHNEPVRTA